MTLEKQFHVLRPLLYAALPGIRPPLLSAVMSLPSLSSAEKAVKMDPNNTLQLSHTCAREALFGAQLTQRTDRPDVR